MEVKVDKKGLVWVKGAAIKDAHNAKELYALFDEGSKNRHTASTSKYSGTCLIQHTKEPGKCVGL